MAKCCQEMLLPPIKIMESVLSETRLAAPTLPYFTLLTFQQMVKMFILLLLLLFSVILYYLLLSLYHYQYMYHFHNIAYHIKYEHLHLGHNCFKQSMLFNSIIPHKIHNATIATPSYPPLLPLLYSRCLVRGQSGTFQPLYSFLASSHAQFGQRRSSLIDSHCR